MATFSVVTNFKTTLAQGMTASQLTATLASITIQGHALVTADYGSKIYLTINPGASNMEVVRCTSNASTVFTVDLRGLAWYGAAETELAAYKFTHNAGETVICSNVKNIYESLVDTFSDETIAGIKTFSDSPIVPTPTTATQAANKSYVDGVAIAGAPDASTTVKGIVEEATDAELQAGTATGSTSARLFAGGASHTQTATANKVPVGKSNAKLDDGWLGLTTAGDIVYSDGTDLQRLAKGTTGYFLEAGASAPTWGGANLAEANTFFGATDITGAEAETLTSASTSNADALHTHSSLSRGFSLSFGKASTAANALAQTSTPCGYSDATTKNLCFGCFKNGAGCGSLAGSFNVATMYGIQPFIAQTNEQAFAAVNTLGLVVIGTDFWQSLSSNVLKKDSNSATYVSGAVSVGPLGHDPTLSYLLVLSSTTNINRYSGVSGTALTQQSSITLDTAVTATKGFVFDNTNSRYICLDTSNNLIRRFGSTGTTIDTLAYTFDDTNFIGLQIVNSRVYIVAQTQDGQGDGTTGSANVSVQLIPTTMTL